ncbi:helix-turn-helix domain-containing protein [Schaalia turicensis]|uniref:helix-turn-helix domain-containing protein n=1 Tax=Schaalia turicensis TaxID=131111 RepID=UPI0036CC3966
MTFSRNRALVLAITQGNMTLTQASQHFNLSTRHIQRLLTRYHEHGIEGLKRTGFCSYLFLRGLGTCLEGIRKSLRPVRFGWWLAVWRRMVLVLCGRRSVR